MRIKLDLFLYMVLFLVLLLVPFKFLFGFDWIFVLSPVLVTGLVLWVSVAIYCFWRITSIVINYFYSKRL